jgi:fructose transport system permease protein
VLHSQPALSPAIVLVLACVGFSLTSSHFYHLQNLSLVLQQVAVVGTLAAGQTLIILTAGIDLSIGAIMVLSSLVMATLSYQQHVPGVLALLVGVAIAIAAQGVNGFLVTRIKLPPFIVTLGMLSVFTAIALIYAQGQTIQLNPGAFLLWTGSTFSIGSLNLSYGVVLMIVVYAVLTYALRWTAWGRHLYAVGDDAEAARLAGIRVNRTSLFGGRGVVLGSLIGALIVQVFDNGLALAGLDPNYQVLAVGILVIAAVSIDQWIRSVRA